MLHAWLRALLAGASILLVACGSLSVGGNDASAMLNGDVDRDSTDDFDVQIEQPSSSNIVPQATQYDAKYTITISNRTNTPVKVTRVALQSVGSGGGSELPMSFRRYDRTIAPHQREKIEFWATVTLGPGRIPMLPTILRASIDFESEGTTRKESFTRNMGGRASVTVGG